MLKVLQTLRIKRLLASKKKFGIMSGHTKGLM